MLDADYRRTMRSDSRAAGRAPLRGLEDGVRMSMGKALALSFSVAIGIAVVLAAAGVALSR
jgi:hypothetical protein